jgi:hypothetical protein
LESDVAHLTYVKRIRPPLGEPNRKNPLKFEGKLEADIAVKELLTMFLHNDETRASG